MTVKMLKTHQQKLMLGTDKNLLWSNTRHYNYVVNMLIKLINAN